MKAIIDNIDVNVDLVKAVQDIGKLTLTETTNTQLHKEWFQDINHNYNSITFTVSINYITTEFMKV